MLVPYGSKFLASQCLIDDSGKEVLGCFLDKKKFAVHWFHEMLDVRKPSKSYQTVECEPLYVVEYPLLCYTGPFPDNSEIRIVNLADKEAPRVSM